MRTLRITLACLAGAAVVYLGLTRLAWPSVTAALRDARPALIAAALLSVLLTLSLVTLRWAVLIGTRPAGSAVVRLWNSILAGQAVNIVAPLRFGEGVRLGLTCRWLDLAAGRVAAALAIERASDVGASAAAILALLALGLMPDRLSGAAPAAVAVAGLSVVVLLGLVYALPGAVRRIAPEARRDRGTVGAAGRTLRWIRQQAGELETGFRTTSWERLASVVLLTGVILAASAWTNLLVFRAFSLAVPWFAAVVVLVMLQVGTAVVSVPGNLGVFHWLTVLALGAWDVPAETALAAAVVLHLVSLGPKIVLGGVALAAAGGTTGRRAAGPPSMRPGTPPAGGSV